MISTRRRDDALYPTDLAAGQRGRLKRPGDQFDLDYGPVCTLAHQVLTLGSGGGGSSLVHAHES